ncbi:E3 ubiquitin-protein ligase LRSAM1-like isoform X2 [Sitophilus oryzae]|uniref:E3 ubiquitin-protein ligase LRSAM1-like isoform X2 n=1 Tax=Sitophilus oryzae TaxID=7048 RepID=A0A6J2XT42_SITOR|nr:E3 ubiquitin-protein ligase LRSAM1-like isoform X2 [Sitophilus oryzae]
MIIFVNCPVDVPFLKCDITFIMFRRKKSVNKKKLEHKLYLARESPEPTFDLSDCDLNNVPSGVYSLCRVFCKISLHLQNNQLSSLSGGGDLKDLCNLIILDLHNNLFTLLPADMNTLTNLQELYLQENQLKHLPEACCCLVNLKHLDISKNRLKDLSENIGNLVNLRILKLENNPDLKYLPKSICRAQRLILIELDVEGFLYPPIDIIREGTESIMRYICSDIEFPYVSPNDVEDIQLELPSSSLEEVDKFQLMKMQEFLEIEKNNALLQKQEIEFSNLHRANKEKLLSSIAAQQTKLDNKLSKIQQKKEYERFHLIEQLQEAENNADEAINKLLALNQEPQIQLLERELEEEQKLIIAVNRHHESLYKDDILAAMQDILSQEAELFKKFDNSRIETSRSILEQELEKDSKLSEILQNQDLQKSNLVAKLLEDSDLQKVAVGTLLERGDARSWGLVQQVRLVESQLLALTNIEIDRKKLKIDEHLNDLSEKRLNLSILLVELLDQQKERRAQLLSTLRAMEEQNTNNVDDFWLRQYQRLLERLPEGLSHAQKNIDQKLAEILLINGVLHCLPFLAKLTQCQSNTKNITENDLIEAGISNAVDRLKIIDALCIYSKEHLSCEFTPSAPLLENEGASAPPLEHITPFNSLECVICMEVECHIIFVPCGHLCCCSNCSLLVAECPLCRACIERKITIMELH